MINVSSVNYILFISARCDRFYLEKRLVEILSTSPFTKVLGVFFAEEGGEGALQSSQDLIAPAKDWTRALGSESGVSSNYYQGIR